MKFNLIALILVSACVFYTRAENDFLEGSARVFDRVLSALKPSPYIVGGEEAGPHSHPYAVYLKVQKYSGEILTCTGSLISPKWILSAAHCVRNELDSVTVYMGVHDISKGEKSKQVKTVVQFIRHPQWTTDYWIDNDIALLRLGVNVTYDEYIQPIRLPSLTQKNKSFWQFPVTVVGWGKTGDERDSSPTLLSVESTVVLNIYCSWNFVWGQIKSFHICTDGSNQRGACKGDSGGPLTIIEDDGKRTLIGVTSFGNPRGCEQSYPSVFARVTTYIEWISETTGIPIRTD